METAKYLCEFFFGNFWHFVMLCLLFLCIGGKSNSFTFYREKEKEKKDD